MNLILERTDQVRFFTNMREVIAALGISCSDYDWYVSDIETNGFQFAEGWYSGSELELQITSDDIQFIWAVFSAFPKGERVDVKEVPFVDGNPHYELSSNLVFRDLIKQHPDCLYPPRFRL
jgi:hypothetical protein